MKAAAVLLLCGIYHVSCHGGGIKMKIGQHGLNKVVSYLMDNELIPYLQNDLEFGEHTFKFGAATLRVEKIRLHQLEGQYGRVSELSGNKLGVIAGFSSLALRTNLTRIAGDDSMSEPKTVVYFHNCRLDIQFLLGSEQDKDGLTLNTCKATIGNFTAEGTFGPALQGIYTFTGEAGITSIVEKVCPYLENVTNDKLTDILSVQDTISVSSNTVGDVLVNMKLLSMSTENDFIIITVEVTTGTDPFLGGVSFPSLNPFQSNYDDVVIVINDKILSQACQLAIQNTIFEELVFQRTIEQVLYKVQADRQTIQGTVTSSDAGTSVTWNATFDIRNGHSNCSAYRIAMDSVIPFVFDYNDTIVVASVDLYRSQIGYRVSSWDRSCDKDTESLEASKSVQRNLLLEINKELETLMRGKSFSLKLPKDKWYGFKKAHIKPLNRGVAFSFGMRVGKRINLPEEELSRIHNEQYNTKVVSYKYSDGQQVQIGVPGTTSAEQRSLPVTTTSKEISASSVPFLSVYSMFLSILVVMFSCLSHC